MNIKKNDIIELDIIDLNNLGCGVGRLPDGMTVFVKGAVTGDKVRAKIIKLASSYAVARLESVLSASAERFDGTGLRQIECKAPMSCGGCVYRNIKYEHELALKREYVKNAFRKAGLPDVEVDAVRTTGCECAYRNKRNIPLERQAEKP